MMTKDDERYTDRDRAWRWIFYTAFPSILTYILAIIYDSILGYKIIQSLSNHFLEFILMVFAISFSIWGSAADIERKIRKKTKEFFVAISVTCCFICLVFYGVLYYISKLENDTTDISLDHNAAIIIRILFVIIATIVIYAGYYYEANAKESVLDITSNLNENKKE